MSPHYFEGFGFYSAVSLFLLEDLTSHLRSTEIVKLTIAPTVAKITVLRMSPASMFITTLKSVPPTVPAFVPDAI